MLYATLLFLHSILRWFVLALGVAAVVAAWQARSANAPYSPAQQKLASGFVGMVHTNFLLGVVLFARVSPLTQMAFADFAAAMKTTLLRFFTVEHPTGMLIAVVIATVGAARIKRAKNDELKHQRVLVFFGLALSLILLSIPWPFYPAGRPLLSLPW